MVVDVLPATVGEFTGLVVATDGVLFVVVVGRGERLYGMREQPREHFNSVQMLVLKMEILLILSAF